MHSLINSAVQAGPVLVLNGDAILANSASVACLPTSSICLLLSCWGKGFSPNKKTRNSGFLPAAFHSSKWLKSHSYRIILALSPKKIPVYAGL